MNQMNQQNQQNDMAKKGAQNQGQGIDHKQNDAAKKFSGQDQTRKDADARRTDSMGHEMDEEAELSADADLDDEDSEDELQARDSDEDEGRVSEADLDRDEDTTLNTSGVQEGKKPPTEINRKAV